MSLRALLVSYAFPPVGGAGVQRVAKLVKYLPAHGVTPSVLTVKNPSVPVRDESLLGDLPRDLRVLRARTLEPGYALKQATWDSEAKTATAAGAAGPAGALRSALKAGLGQLGRAARGLLVPDAQILWQPGAAATLGPALRGPQAPEVVFISAPPFSQFLLGPLVRLLGRGVGLVLDYRDEWSTYRTAYEMGQGGLGARLGGPMEEALLRAAHFVTTATPEFRENLLSHFPFLDPARVVAIPNGYDPDDFPARMPSPPPAGPPESGARYVLSYAGTVFRLTSARGLLGAVRRLHEREPRLAQQLELRFMGRVVETERDAFAGSEALGVRQLGYLDHRRVLEELAASHRTLCLLDEVPGAERIYPGKVFELMYLGRPALVLSPEGALARLCKGSGLGAVLPPRDEAAICDFLEGELRAFAAGQSPVQAPLRDLGRYHRAALAGEIAAVLRQAAALGRGEPLPPTPRITVSEGHDPCPAMA